MNTQTYWTEQRAVVFRLHTGRRPKISFEIILALGLGLINNLVLFFSFFSNLIYGRLPVCKHRHIPQWAAYMYMLHTVHILYFGLFELYQHVIIGNWSAGRTSHARGPHAARGPQVENHCSKSLKSRQLLLAFLEQSWKSQDIEYLMNYDLCKFALQQLCARVGSKKLRIKV